MSHISAPAAPDGRILDLGCATGPLASGCGRLNPGALGCLMVDTNRRAVALAQKYPRQRRRQCPGPEGQRRFRRRRGKLFAAIKSGNPPIRAGKKVIYPLPAEQGFSDAGGRPVAGNQKKQGARLPPSLALLQEIFGNFHCDRKIPGLLGPQEHS